ncbi:MAG: hypothetical protein IJK92_05775 [Bacteroidales bacterium]|nr:hypothetical protein [Bacteroidales bacterium]
MLKRILFIIVMSVLFVACKGDKQNGLNTIEKIKIETSQNKFDVNAIYEIKLRVLKPKGAKLDGQQLKWECCDTTTSKIIELSNDSSNHCFIKFLKKGRVKIKAKVGNAEDTITLKTRFNNIGWWLAFAFIVTFGSYILGYFKIIKLHINDKSKKQPQSNPDSKELKKLTIKYNQLLEEKDNYKNKHKNLVNKYNQLAKDYNQLWDNYKELVNKYKSLKKQSTTKATAPKTSDIKKVEIKVVDQVTEKPTNNNSVMYADCIVDSFFNNVTEKPDEDTVFELHTSSNTADFIIYSGAKRRIIANPAYLDGCEKQIIGDSEVIVEEKGTAQIQMDGKWKIINNLKVIIK